jgi:polysaccharide pyruvyl transferase WcaK-like protein
MQHLLIIAGWQRVNIGDIAHVPAILALAERELPDVRVTLWPFKALAQDFVPTLERRFPAVDVLEPFEPARSLDDPRILEAIDSADFCLHASGPATLGWRQLEAFADRTGRDFGVFGTTYGLYGIPERATLDRARFVCFRDSPSLAAAARDCVRPLTAPGLVPDCAFAFDMRDEARASDFLASHQLEPRQFVCVLARLAHTPFWEMPSHPADIDYDRLRQNQESAERLTTPVRDAVIEIVRNTRMRVLLCPEDTTQIGITRKWIYDRLPDDVLPRVVWRDRFWMPDEAASVYAQSAAVVSTEQHSPILAVAAGVPAVLGRWATQSTKGFMWRDLGMDDWLFDFDRAGAGDAFVEAAVRVASESGAAFERARVVRSRIQTLHRDAMTPVRKALTRPVEVSGADLPLASA